LRWKRDETVGLLMQHAASALESFEGNVIHRQYDHVILSDLGMTPSVSAVILILIRGGVTAQVASNVRHPGLPHLLAGDLLYAPA